MAIFALIVSIFGAVIASAFCDTCTLRQAQGRLFDTPQVQVQVSNLLYQREIASSHTCPPTPLHFGDDVAGGARGRRSSQ